MALVWSAEDDEYFDDLEDEEEEPWELHPSLTDDERNPSLARGENTWKR